MNAMEQLISDARSLFSGTRHPLANAANLAALIYQSMENLNWAGFYFMHRGALLLGSFQGRPACLTIALDRGVCGKAARTNTTQRVDDVHAFPGHIACDERSRSELVIPIRAGNHVAGVLDLDSPALARFTREEQWALESLVRLYEQSCDWECMGYDI